MQAERELCASEGPEAAVRRNTELARMVAELLQPSGHRVRMRLLFCAAEQGGTPDTSLVEHAAFAVELLHIGSLVHDDVIDRARLRRSAPTAVARWGNHRAALAGGAILTRAVRHIAFCADEHVCRFMRAATDMCDGGLRELLAAHDPERATEHYLATVEEKTASLLATAGSLGAGLAGAGERECRAITCFGHSLGVAWQIWDDVIDLAASSRDTGKSANDLSVGVITLPVILALEADDALCADFTASCTHGDSLDQFRDQILKTDGPARAIALAERYAERAATALGDLPEPDELHLLLTETRQRHLELPTSIEPADDGEWTSLRPSGHRHRLSLDDYVAATSSSAVSEMLALAARIDAVDHTAGTADEAAEHGPALGLVDATANVMSQLSSGPATNDDSVALLAADRALTTAMQSLVGGETRTLIAIAEQAEVAFERALDS